jgi:hypothetical protein
VSPTVVEATLDAAPASELVPKLAMACFQTAYERWVRDPGRDLPGLVDESFAALGGIAG